MAMSNSQTLLRQPQGQRTGGQFAAHSRPDADTALAPEKPQLPATATRYAAANRPDGRYIGPGAGTEKGFPSEGWKITYVSSKSVNAVHPSYVGEVRFGRDEFEIA